jgi:tetratricopeptide (TPR) repeat protein
MRIRSLPAVMALAALVGPASAAAPPPRPTAEQRSLLRKRFRLLSEMAEKGNAGRLDEAAKRAAGVLRLDRRLFGDTHRLVADTLRVLGALQEKQKLWKQAADSRRESAAIVERLYGPRHYKALEARRELADGLRRERMTARQREEVGEAYRLLREMEHLRGQGKAAGVIPLGRRAVRSFARLLGENHPHHAVSLNNLAALYHETADYEKARSLYRSALRVYREAKWEKHPEYAKSLQGLAAVRVAAGEYPGAVALCREVLLLRRELLGESHPDFAAALNNLASAYLYLQEYDKALLLLRQALRLRKDLLGQKHPDYASSLSNLAGLYKERGEYDKALPLYRQALRLRRELPGESRPDLASSLADLGGLYRLMGEYTKALPLLERSLRLRREALGERHPACAEGLHLLALLHQDMGEYAKALSLMEQSLRLEKAALGEMHPAYLTGLGNAARLYHVTGDHGKALALLLKVLRAHRQAGEPKRLSYAAALHNLALLYQEMGEHREALPLLLEAIRLHKDLLGDRGPHYAANLRNLAVVYVERGELDKALSLLRESLELFRQALGEKHPVCSGILSDLAVIYQKMGRPGGALPLLHKALALRQKALGERHPDCVGVLHNLGMVYLATGRADEALALLRRSSELCRDTLGEKHPYYALGLAYLAVLAEKRGRTAAAVALAGQALAAELAHLENALPLAEERRRLALLERASSYLEVFIGYAARSELPPAERYRWVLSVKGVLASASRSRLDALARDNPELKPHLLELQSARAGLARLAGSSPPPSGVTSWREQFDRLEARKRLAEGRLAEASAEFSRLRRRPTAADVAAALPADSALVEFFSYRHPLHYSGEGWLHDPLLLAFVVRPGRRVALVFLGRAAPFGAAVRAWRRPLLARRPANPDPAVADWLRRYLWLPVEARLDGVKTVLIAPDGELANLPFAALPGKKPGSFLIEQYAFGHLSSGRQLLDPGAARPATSSTGLLALGGLSFGAPPGGESARRWNDLPFTAIEADEVHGLFRTRFPAAPTRKLSGAVRRAALLDALSPGGKRRWRYLHLATHGYFEPARFRYPAALPAAGLLGVAAAPGVAGPVQALANVLAVDDPDILDRRRGFDPTGRTQRVYGRNPMLAAGLVLAGANLPDSDAVLTAEEISGLDLRGCELAVLSACQTALGKQAGYQGVQGLQRAFHDAGCSHLVASLWSVNDAATALLMAEFYEQLWRRRRPPLEALRQAQLAVLKDPDRVRRQAEKLRPLLAKRGFKGEELAARGFEDDAEVGKPSPRPKQESSPVAWWAAWVVSGRPGR